MERSRATFRLDRLPGRYGTVGQQIEVSTSLAVDPGPVDDETVRLTATAERGAAYSGVIDVTLSVEDALQLREYLDEALRETRDGEFTQSERLS